MLCRGADVMMVLYVPPLVSSAELSGLNVTVQALVQAVQDMGGLHFVCSRHSLDSCAL